MLCLENAIIITYNLLMYMHPHILRKFQKNFCNYLLKKSNLKVLCIFETSENTFVNNFQLMFFNLSKSYRIFLIFMSISTPFSVRIQSAMLGATSNFTKSMCQSVCAKLNFASVWCERVCVKEKIYLLRWLHGFWYISSRFF